AQSLGFKGYKKEPKPLLNYFDQKNNLDEHLIDALLCVYAGAKILDGSSVDIVDEAKGEGWCFPIV
ncbi:MAG: hypothetical protein WBF77_08730, partial [Sulfurimonadaceae bacterium]